MKILGRKDIKNIEEKLLPFTFLGNYQAFVKDAYGCDYLLAFSEMHNTIMPLKKYSVKRFNLLQPLFRPVTLHGENLPAESERHFLNELTKEIAKLKLAIRIIQSPSYALFNTYPQNSAYCPFGSYIIDIAAFSEDQLFSAIHTKHRNVIRNAEKQKVEIKWGIEQINEFYSLYHKTLQRSGMYCEPLSYFEKLVTHLPGNLICGVTYWNNKPQCAILLPYTLYGAHYLYGATNNKIEVTGAMNYLHWQAIRLMKKKGIRSYDFAGARLSDVSGTKLEGIQNFKKRFGGNLNKGYLWKKNIDITKCKVFDNLIKIKGLLSRRNETYLDIIDEEKQKEVIIN